MRLERAPAAAPDAFRGLQNSLRELGTDRERREAGGRTDGVEARGSVCSGQGKRRRPSRHGSWQRGQCEASVRASVHHRICTRVEEGVSGFSQAVF